MSNSRRWMWFGTIVITGLGVLAVNASKGGGVDPNQPDGPFVRIGPNYINVTRINFAVAEGDGLMLVFGTGPGDRLKLSGPDAEAMKKRLDTHASQLRDRPKLGPQGNQTPRFPGDSGDRPD